LQKELSVIIPAYNEEAAVGATLKEVAEYLLHRGYEFEIIVISDGSADSTADRVRAVARDIPQIRLIARKENIGKGRTVKEGIGYARFGHCLFMDADNSTTINEWEKFERLFDAGYPVVIASRQLPGSNIIHPQPCIRRFLGGGYRALCRGLFGLDASDFNCGFKAYETAIAKEIYATLQMTDWTFDVEVFCALKARGIRFAEAPVAWTHADKKSAIAPFKTAFASLANVIRLKQRLVRGR